ncbi:polysaccharide export protein EpsE [Duganella sp. P38]|uniref:polysaccharide export protein EpsE n=1 Tax=Duganella sp. P38 TaxID=3423949 RepID=UPI003D7C10A8
MKRFIFWMLAALLASGAAGAAEVLLGPGDVVKATVYNNPDLTTEARITEAGTLTFPLIGAVPVAGLSSTAAEQRIAKLLESGGYIKNAQVNLLVTVLSSQMVSVLGQVNRPGRYPVDGKRSMLDLLALAGGIAPDGGDTVSLIRKRNGVTTKEVIDVVKMVRDGDLNRDFELASNDVLYVERAPRFYIYGEVQRPGPVRLESQMTVLQALAAGGGLTTRGTERGLRVKRRGADGKQVVLDVQPDDLVLPEDVVYVKESWF